MPTLDSTAINAAFFTALGWFLGFFSRYLESRWKGADSLRGALRACMEDIRAVTTHDMLGEEPAPSLTLLEEDSVRLRDGLIAQPRFGNKYWVIYRRLRQVALFPSEQETGMEVQAALFRTLHKVIGKGTSWFFWPWADARFARLQAKIGQESKKPSAKR